MSDPDAFGFGKFIPGFDFLQQLAKGASDAMPQVPGLSNWIAPTMSVEEIEKRISELRAVQYWLEQNGRALAATIQALEVQKMTLSTLKGMDVTMTDLAQALQAKPEPDAAGPSAQAAPSGTGMQVVDPLQWWSALTQQFQQIAATTMQQAAQQNPVQAATQMASDMAQEAVKTASQMSKAASDAATMAVNAPAKPRKKAAPRKAAAKKAKTSSRSPK